MPWSHGYSELHVQRSSEIQERIPGRWYNKALRSGKLFIALKAVPKLSKNETRVSEKETRYRAVLAPFFFKERENTG